MDDPRVDVHSLTRRNLGPIKPVKAQPTHWAPSLHPEDAFRATLLDCLAQITANAAALRHGRSVEGLHQLRVAFRRLDTALDAFGREFAQDWLVELRGRGKILTGRFSTARDLDVFVEKLVVEAKWGVREGLPQLKERAESARDAAWEGVGACIANTDFERFTDDVAALASSQLPLSRDKRMSRAAERMLDRQCRRVKKRGKQAGSGREGDLHRLRIGLKKLRYTCEFFAPLYSKKKVSRYLKKLRGLQNHLGDLNDVANVRSVVHGLLKEKTRRDDVGALSYAAGAMVGWYGAQVPSIGKQALKRYRRFKKVKPFWVSRK
jgi:CHAD domain-containing protein